MELDDLVCKFAVDKSVSSGSYDTNHEFLVDYNTRYG
jgi:hypothetical protein